jgi:hypothetical protein
MEKMVEESVIRRFIEIYRSESNRLNKMSYATPAHEIEAQKSVVECIRHTIYKKGCEFTNTGGPNAYLPDWVLVVIDPVGYEWRHRHD